MRSGFPACSNEGHFKLLNSNFPGLQSVVFRRVLTLRTFNALTFKLPRISVCCIQEGFNPPDIKTSYIQIAPDFSPGREQVSQINSSDFSPTSSVRLFHDRSNPCICVRLIFTLEMTDIQTTDYYMARWMCEVPVEYVGLKSGTVFLIIEPRTEVRGNWGKTRGLKIL